jgi:antitoxin ParD1/3/4
MKNSISVGEDARLVQDRDARLASLDASLTRGVADADAGRIKPIFEAFAVLESKLKTKAPRR